MDKHQEYCGELGYHVIYVLGADVEGSTLFLNHSVGCESAAERRGWRWSVVQIARLLLERG